jgi:multidrug efflux pump subunit AcrA (membrane-fusion protein)
MAWVAGGAGLGFLVFALVLWKTGLLGGRQPYTGPTWTVRKERLEVTIVARGLLESAENSDIYCKVRSGTKGSTTSTVIKSIVDEGTEVKKGDEIMVLDASGFQ